MSASAQSAAAFEPHRRHLTGLAYRMLGSLADAEDIVQEAYLRWQADERSDVREPRAFLSKLVTRLCLDELKSARVKREEYVGPWLPEPILDDSALTPEAATEYAADLSVALLLALERLSPLERAAFLLHDVFDVDFAEVADALGRNEAAVRQLAARARANVAQARPRFKPEPAEAQRLINAFVAAAASGDARGLAQLLAKDAVFYSDGGGKVRAALRPIVGAERIGQFVAAVLRSSRLETSGAVTARAARINGLPGLVFETPEEPLQTMAFEIRDGRIANVYVVRNPDKLKGLRAPRH